MVETAQGPPAAESPPGPNELGPGWAPAPAESRSWRARLAAWRRDPWAWAYAALGLFAAVRLAATVADPTVDADEGVMGLMALHVLDGREPFPVYYWGQPYLGTLAVFLLVPFFALFGATGNAMHAAMGVFWLAGLVTANRLAAAVGAGRGARFVATALVVLSPFVDSWAFRSHPYMASLAETTLLLVWFFRARQRDYRAHLAWFVGWGLLAGAAFWQDALLLPVFVAVFLGWLFDAVRTRFFGWPMRLVAVAAGIGLGTAPVWTWTLRHDIGNIQFLFLDRRPMPERIAEGLTYLRGLFVEGLPNVLSVRDPWATQWVWPALAWIVFAGLVGALAYAVVGRERPFERRVLALSALGVCAALVVSKHGSFTAEARYLTLVWIAYPALLAVFLERLASHRIGRWAALGLVAVIAAYDARCPPRWLASFRDPDPLLLRVARGLEALGATRVYASYWDAYAIAFYSNERVIPSPRYGPWRHSRYEPYDRAVNGTDRFAFLLEEPWDQAAAIRDRILELGGGPQSDKLDRYIVLHRFQTDIRPELDRVLGL